MVFLLIPVASLRPSRLICNSHWKTDQCRKSVHIMEKHPSGVYPEPQQISGENQVRECTTLPNLLSGKTTMISISSGDTH